MGPKMGPFFGLQNWYVCAPLLRSSYGAHLWAKRGPLLGTKKGSISGLIFGQKNNSWGKNLVKFGPSFLDRISAPPQDFLPYYVATCVSLELGPFCAVNRVLTIQTTLDSRVLVLSQQCPRWQATYNGQNVAEATLVERGLCSSTWTRPPSPSTMVSRKAWSYSLSLRRQELSQ